MTRASKKPRQHHWIPQFYLKNFTDNGAKSGHLYVIDKITKKRFKTKPRGVGGSRDFNKITVKDLEEDFFETTYAKFEHEADKSILQVDKTLIMNNHDKKIILNLIALLAVRNPNIRKKFSNFLIKLIDSIMELSLHNESRYSHVVQSMKEKHPDAKMSHINK